MDFLRFIWIVSFLLPVCPSMVNSQEMQECSLRGIGIQHCLDPEKTPFSLVSCCKNLNQAVQAGYYCMCSLLGGPANPLLTTKISLLLSDCYITMPSGCHDSLTELSAPGIPEPPALNQPPPSMLNDLFMPSPPKVRSDNASIFAGEPTLSSSPVPKLNNPERWDCVSGYAADNEVCLQLRILLLAALFYVFMG